LPKASAARRAKESLDLIAEEAIATTINTKEVPIIHKMKNLGIRGISRVAQGNYPQDRVIECNSDLDEIRATDRVEPECLPS